MPYDPDRAQKAVDFIESLRHYKGEWAGKRIILEPWQKNHIIKPLFGTVREDGLRQFRTAYIEIPRKNGKTMLAAAISLYLLCADGEAGAEMEGAATTRDQAGKLYNAMAGIISQSGFLQKILKVRDYKKKVILPKYNSFYEVTSSEADSEHGGDLFAAIFDELHAQKDREFFDVIATSFGSRREPLFVQITTAGYDKESICRIQHNLVTSNYLDDTNKDFINENCYRTLPDSKLRDKSFFGYIRAAADDAEYDDRQAWYDANPALESEKKKGFRKLSDIEELSLKAERDIAFRNTFKRLYLNIWTDSRTAWINQKKWRDCGDEYTDEFLEGRLCYGGLDLSSTTDLTAFVLLFPIEGYLYIKLYPFIPIKTVRERSKEDGVPYQAWADQGYIITTPGDSVDQNTIKRTILEANQKYVIHSIGYDSWEATKLVTEIMERIEMVPIGMSFKPMSSPTKALIKYTIDGKIKHRNNPVLDWCSSNLMLLEDNNENKRPSKKDSTERIDPMVALIMAIDRYNRETGGGESGYDERVKQGESPIIEVS